MLTDDINLVTAVVFMSHEYTWMQTADDAILEDLHREQPEYIPLVANRLGMHVTYVETRCDLLTDYGLLKPVTDEVIYAVTDRGEAYLRGELDVDDLADVW
jgi:hypothetical protein